MGGTWMAFVMGFGGLRVRDGRLIFNPFLPPNWKSYSFKINFRGAHIEVIKDQEKFTIFNHSSVPAPVTVFGKNYLISGNETREFLK
jgi:maltose phosphorylase